VNHAADPFREQLGAFLLDRLDGESEHRLREHLDECTACRREADELADTASLLGILDEGDRRRLLSADDGRADTTLDLPGWLDDPMTADARSDGPAAEVPLAPADLIDRVLARGTDDRAGSGPTPPRPPLVGQAQPPEDSTFRDDARPGDDANSGSPGDSGSRGDSGPQDELTARRASGSRRTSRSRRSPRWSRWAIPLTAAAAAVAAGAIVVGTTQDSPPRTEIAASVLAPPAGASATTRGELELTSTGRGSQVTMHVRNAVPGMHCVLLLQTGTGTQRQVAEWVVSPGGVVDVRATTDLRPSDVPRALVETVDHQLLLSGTVATS
jgi:hypothetical protein